MTDKKFFLGRSQALSAEDKQIEEIFVPEWGGNVRVRSLSSKEFQQLLIFLGDGKSGYLPILKLASYAFRSVMNEERGSLKTMMFPHFRKKIQKQSISFLRRPRN